MGQNVDGRFPHHKQRLRAMKKSHVYLMGIGGVLADYISSVLILEHPEAYETNPHYHPLAELTAVGIGIAGIQALGDALNVDEKVSVPISAIIPLFPFMLAANNTWLHAIVHAKDYPWQECPLLYPEAGVKG